MQELLEKAAANIERVADTTKSHGEQLQEVKAHLRELEQLVVSRPGGAVWPSDMDASPVDQFLQDSRFLAVTEGAKSSGRVALKAGVDLLRKATLFSVEGGGGAGTVPVAPQRDPGLHGYAQRPVRLLDLLPKLPATSNSFEFLQLTSAPPVAGYQLIEGGQKSEAAITAVEATARIVTIAHWVKASVQVLDDAPALRQQLGNLLQYGLLDKLEFEILNGTAAAGGITGLLEQAPLLATAATDPADKLGEAIASLGANGWRPNIVVLNPLAWHDLRSAKLTDNSYVAGSWSEPAPPSVWSVPVVLSSSIARGTALVADTSQVVLLDRMQPTLMVSREDGTDFTKNIATILAEGRWGLAVFSPNATVEVAL